jgi:hypothetical protein
VGEGEADSEGWVVMEVEAEALGMGMVMEVVREVVMGKEE